MRFRLLRFAGKFSMAVIIIFQLVMVNCDNPVDGDSINDRFSFTIADVGQGLAQFGVMGGRAVVWDIGLSSQYTAWRWAYGSLGRPRIEAVVISHTDGDHYGGLQHLDRDVDWDGTVIISPFEDTAKIRAEAVDYWKNRIRFSFVTAGDTLRIFNGVDIICIWPPADMSPYIDTEADLPLNGALRNRFSLVFSVRHGNCAALITSDIDSTAMAVLTVQSGHDLRAQILSVPHHGSANSVNPVFFSYVSPQTAVISCSRQNMYGHPSQRMIDALTYQGAYLMYTYLDGTVTFTSNGFYW